MATTDGVYRSDKWQNDPIPASDSESTGSEVEHDIDRVLAVYGPTNIEKIERHITPLADVVDTTTLVCTRPNPEVSGFRQLAPPSTGVRLLDLFLVSLLTVVESIRGDYDAVVSVSLFPHGCLGLLAARLNGIPAHLGIIGCDIDVHARAWYGRPVRWLIRRFDAVTVPGPTHRRRLHRLVGVPRNRTAILANPVEADRFPRRDDVERPYDLLWVGRLTAEKRPVLFVDVVAAVAERYPSVRAVIIGDGPLSVAVTKRIAHHELEDVIDTPGWIDDPAPWYADASIFALTSERDALPLTLIEAMASGTVPVAPAVGNVADLIVDDWNGQIVDPTTVEGFATAIDGLLRSPERRARLGANAHGVRSRFTAADAAEDWRHVTRVLARSGTR
ncbi:glycosyltransferase family 4 protein [Halorubrum salsamenti]|uniref:glycosyltransferase family 4 protein n=1 Tax=Halorubrum salsamenti TaxID=2583990 RepID=UPI0011A8B0FF|nr:glycosyltransferase family 4 protein [Halorubrum salsamenti]